VELSSPIIRDGKRPWVGPVFIQGREYHFIPEDVIRDGNRVWSASVAFAAQLAREEIEGTSVDLGGGCGLVGMVTGATTIEKDPDTAKLTKRIFEENNLDCRLLVMPWEDCQEKFDNVFGCEIIYPAYKPETIADFINRCWTRRGVCRFATSMLRCDGEFEKRLTDHGLKCLREIRTYQGFEYFNWCVSG